MSLQRIDVGNGYLDWEKRQDGTVEIRDIHVESANRKCGIGRRMVAKLLKSLPPGTRVWAITGADNLVAQQFYEALVFRDVSPLRRFYGDTTLDAIMYIRNSEGAV